ncbi:MAG: PASTA domain-containing protein [Actinomycetota bacterium]
MTNTPEPPTQASVVVADRYRLIEPLARGGVAWVWRAHDETLDRAVAIKIVRADADPVLSERLRAEAQAAAKVRHTGVIAVYDSGTHDGVPFIAMELVEGETLRSLLQREGKLPHGEVSRIGHEVAAALDALHRAGLMHGDLKPENIMATPDGAMKITDLGLARAVWQKGADTSEQVFGTPGYLAPERRHGSPGDARSDIYALGAILFELATGVRPPDGDIPWTQTVDPSVPEELASVIARATDHDPQIRYESAAAMALQLGHGGPTGGTDTQMLDAAERETVALRPPATAPAPARTRRTGIPPIFRSRWMMIAGLLALILGFIWFGPINQTEVPRVVGLTQEAAEARLDAQNLGANIDPVYDDEILSGKVIAQDPAEGATVRKGSAVTLKVSLGPRVEEVPDLAGKSPEEARAALEELGFEQISETSGFSDAVETGEVIGTRPPAGETARTGEPIVLIISSGPKTIKVPVVDGKGRAEAQNRLEDAGFKVRVELQESRSVPDGEVIGTEPKGGTSAQRGSTITMIVSDGPPRVTVPDLGCMSKGQAKDALEERNLKGDFEGKGKRVVDQDPGPGTRVREGTEITVFMGFGAFCRGNDNDED